MMDWRETYVDRWYHALPGWTDGTTEFHALCAENLSGKILEVGSGPENPTTQFVAGLGTLTGLDVDPAVLDNRMLKFAQVFDGVEPFPFSDESFDSCVSNYVVEHVTNPRLHLSEIYRVLKPGGVYVLRTPNRWHYVALAASILPHAMHRAMANRLRGLSNARDPYPTVYAMNSRRRIERFAVQSGFRVETLRMVEKEPMYGLIARPLFVALVAYERCVNATEALGCFRANMFVVLRKNGK